MHTRAKLRTVTRTRSVAAAYWPEPLRRFATSANRIRLGQRTAVPGQWRVTLFAAGVLAMVVGAGLGGQLDLFGMVAGCVAAALLFAAVACDFFRWVAIERTATGWIIEHGIGRWGRRRETVEARRILTALILEDLSGEGGAARRRGFRIQLEQRSLRSAEAPPAVRIGDGLCIPLEELELIRRLLLRDVDRRGPGSRYFVGADSAFMAHDR